MLFFMDSNSASVTEQRMAPTVLPDEAFGETVVPEEITVIAVKSDYKKRGAVPFQTAEILNLIPLLSKIFFDIMKNINNSNEKRR